MTILELLSPPPLVGVFGGDAELVHAVSRLARVTVRPEDAHTVDVVIFAGDPFAHAMVATQLDTRASRAPRFFVVGKDLLALELAGLGAVPLDPSMLEDVLSRVLAGLRPARRDPASQEATLGAIRKDGSTLVHDARVLFGVILGYASNLRDGFVGDVTDEQREKLESIVLAAGDASTLLDRFSAQLKRAGEPPAESSRPGRRSHDLAPIVDATQPLFEGMALEKGLSLRVLGALEPAVVSCDPMQIKQALVNLVANALKFTPTGGEIEVSIDQSVRGEIAIVVADSGPGVPEADRERIFERGTRLARDADRPGSGIGLSVVREVALAHGGSARVEPRDGGGARFVLSLPADPGVRRISRLVPEPTIASGDPE